MYLPAADFLDIGTGIMVYQTSARVIPKKTVTSGDERLDSPPCVRIKISPRLI
jgi:hypothetical protein